MFHKFLTFSLWHKSDMVRVYSSMRWVFLNAVPSGSGATALSLNRYSLLGSILVALCPWCTQRLSPIRGVTCINSERAAMRDASRALLPLFVFSCHALVAQQWISMRDTAGSIHKLYPPFLKQSARIDALFISSFSCTRLTREQIQK